MWGAFTSKRSGSVSPLSSAWEETHMILVLRDISFQGRCVNNVLSPRCVPLGESLGCELRRDHNNLETVSGLGCCCTQWPPRRAWPRWNMCFRPLSEYMWMTDADEPSVQRTGAVGTNSIQLSSRAPCQTNARCVRGERGEPSLYHEPTTNRSWSSGRRSGRRAPGDHTFHGDKWKPRVRSTAGCSLLITASHVRVDVQTSCPILHFYSLHNYLLII